MCLFQCEIHTWALNSRLTLEHTDNSFIFACDGLRPVRHRSLGFDTSVLSVCYVKERPMSMHVDGDDTSSRGMLRRSM
jgi:hypothetical protein